MDQSLRDMLALRPSDAGATGISVRVVTAFGDFESLRAEWTALVGRCTRKSVFLTHEWFDAAWQWRRLASELRVICAYRDGTLAGVLPLVLDRGDEKSGGTRRLEFLTVPDTQFCDVIVAEKDREWVVRAFAEELHCRRGEWDVLRLRYLPDESVATGALLVALRSKGCRVVLASSAPNPYVALNTTWDEYYATRTRSLKKANNLAANRLKKVGEVAIEWLQPGTGDPETVRRLTDEATLISQRSWKSETGNSLENPGPQAFIRRLSEVGFEKGWLSIWLLSLDGKPFAMEYQLVADEAVYALRSDFDAECERLQISPGSHLSRHLLEQLFGRGLKRYFMGPGNNAYKYRWTEQTAPTHEMTAYASTLRGRWLAAWETTLKPAARRLRDRLRKPESTPSTRSEDGQGGSGAA